MAEQMTLGDDFATGEQLGLVVGRGRATRTPLADKEQLKAQQERRDALELGQIDILDEVAEVAAAEEAGRRHKDRYVCLTCKRYKDSAEAECLHGAASAPEPWGGGLSMSAEEIARVNEISLEEAQEIYDSLR